jgi:hypothetical protein
MKSNDSINLSSFGIESNQTTTPTNDREQRLIDTIAAVIALKESRALQPQNKSFAAVQGKISSRYMRRLSPWSLLLFGSGWAAAAAVTLFFTYHITSDQETQGVTKSSMGPVGSVDHSMQAASPSTASTHDENIAAKQKEVSDLNKEGANGQVKVEQRSLIQEIETLRLTISDLEKRDNERLTPMVGVTWPLIIKMTRPGEEGVVIASNNDILHSMLNEPDALVNGRQNDSSIANQSEQSLVPPVAGTESNAATAIPIYDPARDKGQLIVNNLPVVSENQNYYLWVKTNQGKSPFLVGTLPNNINTTSETFDFRLGTTGIIPDSFQITLDGPQNPSLPQSSNIILQGPAKEK